jgi:hypothetical protein
MIKFKNFEIKVDELVKSQVVVIPAKAGIQCFQ